MNHFGQFRDAAKDLQDQRVTAPIQTEAMMKSWHKAQRFYLPGAIHLLGGKEYDESLRECLKLPFESVVVLSDPDPQWNIDNAQPWHISFAWDSALSPEIEHDHSDRLGWFIASMLKQNDCCRRFHIQPGIGFCCFLDSGEMYSCLLDFGEIREMTSEFDLVMNSVKLSIHCVQNLCLMLSLRNVRTAKMQPPEALQGKIAKKNGVPLLSYRVLVVDGDKWDRPSSFLPSSGGIGKGKRSHYRRGHIRRIDEQHKVWVRNTLVHGSVPGFVDKHYEMAVSSR